MKSDKIKNGKLTNFAEGTNSNIPKASTKNDNTIPPLYPIFLIIYPDGIPKITKDEKVAAITR